MISRTLFVCLLLAVGALTGCDEPALRAREEHVLGRIGYGPDFWSRQRIRTLGVDAYVDEQLHPERLDDSVLEARLRSLYPSLSMSLRDLYQRYDRSGDGRSDITPHREISQAKLLRAVQSKRQLEQVLVDFWFNHFNVDARREVARWAIVPYERDAIRPHVLGRFEDMLRAVARHPAMLEYLDNAQSFRPGFVFDNAVWGINENYARELLELHTVGPDAGQTLSDIRSAALAFTGWTVAGNLVGDGTGFTFLAAGHDITEKRVLGLTLPAGRGIADGDALISYLARHPDTAVHVATKLCRRFVSETPSGCEVAAAARFLATGGDLREVMREILHSEAFRDPSHFRGKVKRPLHAIASVARNVGLRDDATFAYVAMGEIQTMGEPLYAAGPPIGWPDVSSAWLGEGTLVRRLNLAYRAANGTRGMRAPAPLPDGLGPTAIAKTLVDRVLLGGAEPATLVELDRLLVGFSTQGRVLEGTTLLLSGPEFSRH